MKKLVGLLILIGLAALLSPQAKAAPPACLPKAPWKNLLYGSIPSSISSRYDTYAVWTCEQPSGYSTYGYMFNLAGSALQFLQYQAGLLTKAQADADCAVNCVPPTAAEDAFLTPLVTSHYPLALVAFNGSSLTRPVYAANADGTLNPTAVAGSSVAVASRCNEGLRLIGTIYYSVKGLPNASSPGSVLGDVYTICSVNLPLGSN